MSDERPTADGGNGEAQLDEELDPEPNDTGQVAATTTTPVSDFKVLGELTDQAATGVLGQNNATTGTAYGVQGVTRSAEGVASIGRATTTDTSAGLARPAGVEGLTNAAGDVGNGYAPVGVRGRSTGSGVTGGVLGQADSTKGLGVIGESSDGDVVNLLSLLGDQNFTAGVVGFTDRTDANSSLDNAVGVAGIAADPDNTDAENVGVYGLTRSDGGYGMYSDDRIFARADASVVNYAAKFVDYSTGGDAQAVLDLAIRDSTLSTDDNFVRFLSGGSASTESAVGSIESNGSGGVQFGSASADIAEYFPKADPAEEFEAGRVVGLTDGEITGATADADTVGVVSEAPMVSGNVPYDADEGDYERIALVGQVDVRVSAPTSAGDLLVAADDETGTAVPSGEGDAGLVVGIALDGGDAGDRLPTLVGRHDAGAADRDDATSEEVEELRETVQQQAETIERLEERLDALEEADGARPRAIGDD